MTQEQVESQLSAMFDGELPAAECELLSRRIDRDENLRARWSRYALIGAAMRSEPVATARRGFAARVSAALDERGNAHRPAVRRSPRRRALWNTALAASMVTAVAGVSIGMLRYSTPDRSRGALSDAVAVHGAVPAIATPAVASTTTREPGLMPVDIRTSASKNGEPRSYVTPLNQASSNLGLRTELPDLVVAHSVYSSPLIRSSLLSALVSIEDSGEPSVVVNGAAASGGAGQGNAAAASGTQAR